jgi:hypothetical protein
MGPSTAIDSSVPIQTSCSASHSPPATDAARADAASTAGTALVASGMARHTYQAERQTNE